MIFHDPIRPQFVANKTSSLALAAQNGGHVCQCRVRREGGRGGRASQSADKIESHKFRRDKIKSVREAGEAGR